MPTIKMWKINEEMKNLLKKFSTRKLEECVQQEISVSVQKIAESYHDRGYVLGQVAISPAEVFFDNMRTALHGSFDSEDEDSANLFIDRRVFLAVAKAAIDYYLKDARSGSFHVDDKTFYRDGSYLPHCKIWAGHLMYSLGFFEEALNLYQQVVSSHYLIPKHSAIEGIKKITKITAEHNMFLSR